ncbi:hypothetical protein QBC39DRAFT_370660 [Podospora conica]|nr:hypothetical protein QBC39DRAFT_370660 [Schizothecium conicum]
MPGADNLIAAAYETIIIWIFFLILLPCINLGIPDLDAILALTDNPYILGFAIPAWDFVSGRNDLDF